MALIRVHRPQTHKPVDYKPPTTLTLHLSKIPMPELAPKTTNLKPSNSYRPVSSAPHSSSSSGPGRNPYPSQPHAPAQTKAHGKHAKRNDTPSPSRPPALNTSLRPGSVGGGKLHKVPSGTNIHAQGRGGGNTTQWANYQAPSPSSSAPGHAPSFPTPYGSNHYAHAPPAHTPSYPVIPPGPHNYNQLRPLTPNPQPPTHGAGALNSGAGGGYSKPPTTLGLGQLGMNTAMGLLDKLSLRSGQGRGKP